MAYRVEILHKVEDQEQNFEKYRKLNKEAIKKITNNIDKEMQEEVNLKDKLNEYSDDPLNIMFIPILKRHAMKHHTKHDKMRHKAKEEHNTAKGQEYKIKRQRRVESLQRHAEQCS